MALAINSFELFYIFCLKYCTSDWWNSEDSGASTDRTRIFGVYGVLQGPTRTFYLIFIMIFFTVMKCIGLCKSFSLFFSCCQCPCYKEYRVKKPLKLSLQSYQDHRKGRIEFTNSIDNPFVVKDEEDHAFLPQPCNIKSSKNNKIWWLKILNFLISFES